MKKILNPILTFSLIIFFSVIFSFTVSAAPFQYEEQYLTELIEELNQEYNGGRIVSPYWSMIPGLPAGQMYDESGNLAEMISIDYIGYPVVGEKLNPNHINVYTVDFKRFGYDPTSMYDNSDKIKCACTYFGYALITNGKYNQDCIFELGRNIILVFVWSEYEQTCYYEIKDFYIYEDGSFSSEIFFYNPNEYLNNIVYSGTNGSKVVYIGEKIMDDCFVDTSKFVVVHADDSMVPFKEGDLVDGCNIYLNIENLRVCQTNSGYFAVSADLTQDSRTAWFPYLLPVQKCSD